MENYTYSSYPDSVNSSPRSREIDCENASWDDQVQQQNNSNSNSNYKVKFMCSYGGKIHPRPHDNQLTYVGGETKILSVDRNIRFSNLVNKLSALSDYDVCFKYQLPGEDLDALISVTNDEDLEHMMIEYDRLYRGSVKPARLRLFLFPLTTPLTTPATSNFGSTDSKPGSQWFVDALNSVQLQEVNSPSAVSAAAAATVAAPAGPDFLFGLEKGVQGQQVPPVQVKLQDPTAAVVAPPPVTEVFHGGSDDGSAAVEYQRQVHEMQRLQQHISNQEQQAMYNRKIEESIPRGYTPEYYQQKAPAPLQQQQQQQAVPVTNPANFWPERHMMTSGQYPTSAVQTEQQQQPVYIVQTPTGVYQTPAGIRPVTSQMGGGGGQAYYGMPRVMQPPPDLYREQSMYGGVQPQPTMQPPKMGGAYTSESMGMVRPHVPPPPEQTYTQVGYDNVGRQVYYTTAAPPSIMQQQQQQQQMQQQQHPVVAAAAAVEGRQSGGALNQEGRIVGKP